MEILVKKYTAAPRFKAHYNSSMGRYYGTKQEYLADLKAKGLELFAGSVGEHRPPPSHKPSPWAREMVNEIKRSKQPDGTARVGDRFHQELAKRGVSLRPMKTVSSALPTRGGFSGCPCIEERVG